MEEVTRASGSTESQFSFAEQLDALRNNRAALDAGNPEDQARHLVMTGAAQIHQIVLSLQSLGLLEIERYPELLAVLSAVTDVWQRGNSPLFEEVRRRGPGRPPMAFADRIAKQCCVRAVATLTRDGMSLKDACSFLDVEFKRMPKLLDSSDHISGAQIAKWWDQSTGPGAEPLLEAIVTSVREGEVEDISQSKGNVVQQIRGLAEYSPYTEKK